MEKINYLDRKFAAITWDPGFKATFRDPENVNALILLLNTFLPPTRKVKSLKFADREIEGISIENKSHRFDIHCKDHDGNDFIVEMQRNDFDNFMKRCFAYSAQSYVANIDKGDYEYKSAVPIYLISFIVNKSHDQRINNSTNLVKRCWFIDNEGQNFENQFINLIFVRLYEVNNLPKPDKDTPSIDRCCWLMTNLPEMTSEPSPEVVGEFGEIVEAAKIAGYNKQKKRAYKMGMDYEQMQKAINQQQYRNGHAKGLAEGLAEGEAQKARETARKLLAKGMSIPDIAEVTGLTPEDLQSI